MPAMTALVIEDDENYRALLTDALTEKNILVTSYASAVDFLSEHALDRCPQQIGCFDFILADNRLPEMNGLEFLARLGRAGCKVPMHRTGIISGEWAHIDLKIARHLGYMIFYKPCPIQQFFDWIDDAVNDEGAD